VRLQEKNGFKTIGIIRGDELRDKIATNPTLQFAQDCIQFISREEYRLKKRNSFWKTNNNTVIFPYPRGRVLMNLP
jgi:hypothetical protein